MKTRIREFLEKIDGNFVLSSNYREIGTRDDIGCTNDDTYLLE